MLVELRVRDFAIIDDLQLQFHPGFNVLTGETGAGKSIIIDAIELLLGVKSNPDMVRGGASVALIEGILELPAERGQDLRARLEEEGLEGEDNLLILSREVRVGGRSVARINGRAVAQSLLAEIGGRLVDIHGQGQHLSLLRVREHIYLLDRYADLEAQRVQLGRLVGRWRHVRNELESLRRDAREIARRLDLLNYQVEEIESAGLTPGEDDALESERRRLANAETLAHQSTAIYQLLAEGGAEIPPVLDFLGEAVGGMERLARVDPDLDVVRSQAEELLEQVSDLARTLADYHDRLAHDPERLREVEERLELIFQLKRKYGPAIPDILAFGETARADRERLSQHETLTADLEAEEDQLLHEIGAVAAELSAARAAAAAHLAHAIEQELIDLRMAGTRFQVDMQQHPDPTGCYVDDQRLAFDAAGIDQVEFLVSANPGEPLRPLAKVASGGETARLMLALKNVLSRADDTPVLIFDEIDQGIGGRVGTVVGRKLYHLTENHQVLCVTHLAQIAAYGDHHLAVRKAVEDHRTVTRLNALSGDARVVELAAMLGTNTAAGRESAQELLAEVEHYKAERLEMAIGKG